MPRLPYDLEARRPYLVQTFSDAEYERRVRETCAAMAAQGLDALVVYAPGRGDAAAPVTYLTNFTPVYGHAFVVVSTDGRLVVATDGILHAEPMHSMIWTCRVADVRVALGPLYGSPPDEVATLAADAARQAAGAAGHVGLAGGAMLPHGLYRRLAERLPDLRAADGVLDRVRAIKSDEEIAVMREAGRIADEAYAALFAAVAPGVEETTAAGAAVHRMHVLGGREGFATCVVSGAQAGLKHGLPRRRPMREGEMVFADLGVAFGGYMSDVSRCTVVGGRAAGRARDLLQVGLDLYHAGLQVLGPGRTIDEVSDALLAVVRGGPFEPYYCPGGFGHGIGMAVLEMPGLYAGNTTTLRPRMTIAYEPMVVVEGLGTGVVEDTLLITETGYERLSNYPVVTWL
ncbi:MAG: Xaa-Pro peptidase family protein [Armatimonadota bacterium]|nr:Xaa-Pro peptidase family protein [Armatimonadota bacterium]